MLSVFVGKRAPPGSAEIKPWAVQDGVSLSTQGRAIQMILELSSSIVEATVQGSLGIPSIWSYPQGLHQ
jgi:hypothetical protein